ncbi:MAG: alanine--tRNA ligase [Bacilli bacterium]|nr:alanine--tRNA ligase [Bacilli bacterium]
MNIREEYIKYFESKDHKWIPSSPIVPENDPTVLFNTAGMQPLVPYLMGQKHPYGKRLCDYQKCVRLTDLDEIGDKAHHTFFEMLGNWSLGDYFKKESIGYSFEFLTKILGISVDRLAVTVYAGDDKIEPDDVSAKIWHDLGISSDRIAYLSDNFWIAGDSGPCGSDTEIFYFRSNDEIPSKFDPEDDRWVEIWNNVFMEFYKDENGNITELSSKNVDTGMGLERIVSVIEGVDDNYLSSIWKDVIDLICEISSLSYEGHEKEMRIIADHIRTATFIAADPSHVRPSNTDRGYILRRLIRRAIRYAKALGIDINSDWDARISLLLISKYKKYYSELEDSETILNVLADEKIKFSKTIEKGLREFDRLVKDDKFVDKTIAFKLYDTYGFPIELTIEEANSRGMEVDVEGFNEKFKEHQEKSRTASKGMFKGGLLGHSETETKYHTATHLLNAALKKVVSSDVHQLGSNITTERLRFDFPCDHKLSDDEKKRVEDLVNKWIEEDHEVTVEEMKKEDALKSGAECRFIEKYPDVVTVYSIGDFSKELCGGPHVTHTGELGHFKIKKEESNGSGVRRIKAILE